MRIDLLLIDLQVDFCDPVNGKLYVPGAEKDVDRVSAMIDRIGDKFYDIHVTQDSHQVYDIAHPIYWKNSKGQHPAPFTVISVDDVVNGVWVPVDPRRTQYCIDYLKSLKDNQRYDHRIWPEHCLIGTEGHAFMPRLNKSLIEWCRRNVSVIDIVTKGSNVHTEHFSAVQAEVPDPNDLTTQLNTRLIGMLKEADKVVIGGEAGSHCVANTVRDIANNFGDDNIKKLHLLTDAISPVASLEFLQEDFIKEMKSRGMNLTTTTDFLL